MWLVECLKATVSQHSLRVNVFTSPESCRNLHGSTLILISYYPRTNWARKHLCHSHLKSQSCLVTPWPPITYILVIMKRLSRNMFKRHYLQHCKNFLKFFIHFYNLHKILRILKKKITFMVEIFLRLMSPRNMVTWMPDSSCLRTPLQSQRVHVSQTLPKSLRQHFYHNFLLTTDKLS